MAQKKTDNKVETKEKDLEKVKMKIPGLERSIDQLTQQIAKMMLTMEERLQAMEEN